MSICAQIVQLPDSGAGSASGDYYQTRLLLENMVEYIRLKDEVVDGHTHFPVAIGTNKKKKKKRKLIETITIPATALEEPRVAINILESIGATVHNWSTFPYYLKKVLDDEERSIEESNEQSLQIVVIKGVSPTSSLIGTHSLVQDIHTGSIFEVDRQHQLQHIPSEDTEFVYNEINKFVRAQMVVGKPAEVHEKYWDQRYRIFTRFDHGIQLDPESWYSATYECIGEKIADTCMKLSKKLGCPIRTVWDGFSGCGGTGISFCRRGFLVTAIDSDGEKLKRFRHNAGIYGAANQVECLEQDIWQSMRPFVRMKQWDRMIKFMKDKMLITEEALQAFPYHPLTKSSQPSILPPTETVSASEIETATTNKIQIAHSAHSSEKRVDLMVLCPPWGGPEYLNESTWDFRTMIPCGDGFLLTAMAFSMAKNVVLVLPRNTDETQLRNLGRICNCKIFIQKMHIRNKCKLLVLYIGSLFAQAASQI